MRTSDNGKLEELHFLQGGGEMGALIRAYDWDSTPLGPPHTWPQSLKTSVGIMLRSPYPMFVWWGKEMIMFHNDAYVPVLGKRHPEALGKSGPVIWSDVWDFIGPLMEDVLNNGKSCYFERQLLIPERKGYKEETYFTFSYSPIPDDHAGVGGIFCTCSEDTEQVLSQRRLSTLRKLSELTSSASIQEVFEKSTEILAHNPYDMPFGLLYIVADNHKSAKLEGAFGIPRNAPASPPSIALDTKMEQAWPLSRLTGINCSPIMVDKLSQKFSSLPSGPWEEGPTQAIIIPIKKSAQEQLVGFFISGISPRLEFDEEYRSFLILVAGQISTAVANVSALEEERRRMKKLLELDKAKTDFFNNVSHEFRTPLTLMLGPLEDILSKKKSSLPEADREQLTTVYQNTLRLLKLVNTLLDFSRIEAKRVQASYQPLDLCTFTSELAGAFQSAIEKAGLDYEVSCSPLSEPVYVDPDMWEKIVLNLISNALKFTFEGMIRVHLIERETHVQLCVQDSGVGISQEEIPNLFKRFYRIQNSRSRSFEGTGIGLALVKELVELHGGTIEVTSIPEKSHPDEKRGTTFTISIPKGFSHLDKQKILTERHPISKATKSEAYVNEALLWGKRETGSEYWMEEKIAQTQSEGDISPDKNIRILLADDNMDMLSYLKRILSAYWQVETAKDGVEALAAAGKEIPDLIVSDVMMPNMNGFELLSEIRKNDSLKHVPVILLSARAGEEATIEGLEKGANDYLVKPFSARELLARIKTQLQIKEIQQDNNQLREAEEALKKFKLISDYAFDAFILMREDGTFAYLNDLALKRWGYTKEEAQHIRVPDVDPIYQDEKFNQVFALAQKQFIPPFETIHKRKDGTTYPVEVSMGGVTLEGKPHMFAVARDITDRKQAEQALQESKERFSSIFNQTAVGISQTDLTGKIVLANQCFCEITGRTKEDLYQLNIQDITHPEDLEEYLALFKGVVENGTAFNIEKRFIKSDGSIVWVHNHVSTVKDQNGNPLYITGVSQDITGRKKAEESIKYQSYLMQSITDNATAGLFMMDAHGICTFMNPAAEEISGYTFEEIKQYPEKPLHDWIHHLHPDGTHYPMAECPIDRALPENNDIRAHEDIFVHKDGSFYNVSCAARPIIKDGVPVGTLVEVRDITEQKLAEATLKARNEELQKTNNDLDNFIYTASHDLKAPVLNLEGLFQLLFERIELNEELAKLQSMIGVSFERFKNTIKDLTEVAKVNKDETDNTEVEVVRFDDMLEEAKLNIKDQIEKAGTEIQSNFEVPAIQFSGKNLRSIIYNLVSNGVKYRSEERAPLIKISTHKTKDNYILLQVSDNGLGMNPQNKEKIFGMFKRLHNHVEGSGVGLYIVKRIIDNAGGKIEVESEVGKGTTFKVYFRSNLCQS